MSIFGTIISKVFGSGHPAATEASPSDSAPSSPASTEATNTATPGSDSAPPPVASQPSADTTGQTSSAAPSGSVSQAETAPPTQTSSVDVAAVLDGMDTHGQTLDWRHSIVDLMKLLGMDSSLHARKELAHELNYTGDTEDSAAMNIWLHKQVMKKFAENGGKLPSDMHH